MTQPNEEAKDSGESNPDSLANFTMNRQASEIKSLTAERDRLAGEVEAGRIARVEQSRIDAELYAAERDRADRLARELEELKADHESTARSVAELLTKNSRLTAELETLRAINGGYVRDKEEMQKASDALAAQVRELRGTVTEVRNALLVGRAKHQALHGEDPITHLLSVLVDSLNHCLSLPDAKEEKPGSVKNGRIIIGTVRIDRSTGEVLPDSGPKDDQPQQLSTEGQEKATVILCGYCKGAGQIPNSRSGDSYDCQHCDGTGHQPTAPTSNPEGAGEKCTDCDGLGYLLKWTDLGDKQIRCEDCDGTGRRPIQEGGGE